MARSFAEAAINYADYAPLVFPLMTRDLGDNFGVPPSLKKPHIHNPKISHN
jgi:hypothetical protein